MVFVLVAEIIELEELSKDSGLSFDTNKYQRLGVISGVDTYQNTIYLSN